MSQRSVVPVPKNGNTTDPNKWGGVTLMDIGNNIYSISMCEWLFRIISKHGVKWQFGSTPGIGCQDGTFNIKKILNLRHNQNLPTWVAFSDLVKAFDTSNDALLIAILGKYGAPPRLCSVIKHMYNKRIVKLIVDKVETSIEFKVGVKQGYSMAPVIFLFLMIAFRKNTRRRVDSPRTKESPICAQRQLTNINRTISEPLTRHLLV